MFTAMICAVCLLCVSAQDMDGAGGMDMASMMGGMGGGNGEGGMDMEKLMASMGGGMGGGMGGMGGMPPPPPITGVDADVQHILCSTCEQLVKRSVFVITQMREALKKTTVSEDTILEYLAGDPGHALPNAPATASGGICNPDKKEGEWMHSFDMVEDAETRSIALKKMPVKGECGVECKTIALACSEVLAVVESDLATKLYLKRDAAQIKLEMCGAPAKPGLIASLDGACSSTAALTPESRVPGPPFEPFTPRPASPPTEGKKKKKKKKKKGNAKVEL